MAGPPHSDAASGRLCFGLPPPGVTLKSAMDGKLELRLQSPKRNSIIGTETISLSDAFERSGVLSPNRRCAGLAKPEISKPAFALRRTPPEDLKNGPPHLVASTRLEHIS